MTGGFRFMFNLILRYMHEMRIQAEISLEAVKITSIHQIMDDNFLWFWTPMSEVDCEVPCDGEVTYCQDVLMNSIRVDPTQTPLEGKSLLMAL